MTEQWKQREEVGGGGVEGETKQAQEDTQEIRKEETPRSNGITTANEIKTQQKKSQKRSIDFEKKRKTNLQKRRRDKTNKDRQ